mgnify:CR=1 FL=1
MAIFTGRMTFIGNRVLRPVNAIPELLLDTMMASPTGSRNVRRIDHGVRIFRWHFGMRTMAISTGCGYDKTALNQSATVNTVFVATDNVIDVSVYARCRLLANAMATTT